jgi:hypothetical protein
MAITGSTSKSRFFRNDRKRGDPDWGGAGDWSTVAPEIC